MYAIFPNLWELKRFQTASDPKGHSTTLVFVPFGRPHDFLLAFDYNYAPILYCFQDIITYLPKLEEFT